VTSLAILFENGQDITVEGWFPGSHGERDERSECQHPFHIHPSLMRPRDRRKEFLNDSNMQIPVHLSAVPLSETIRRSPQLLDVYVTAQ
jgi:hypothetical protein